MKLCNLKKLSEVEDRQELTVYILWHLWKSKNAWSMEGVWRTAKDIVDNTLEERLEFKQISSKENQAEKTIREGKQA